MGGFVSVADDSQIPQTGYAESEYITFFRKEHGRRSIRVELYDVPGKYWEQNGNIFLVPDIFDAVILCFGLDDVRNLERVVSEVGHTHLVFRLL
jgi:hypothetical protein